MASFNPAKVGNTKHAQGTFVMKYPDKYIGNNPPIYRSSWEKDFMHTCDENPAVMQWAAEPFSIPYMCPVSGTKRNYWPDFLMSYMKKDGTMVHELIEIKPIKESIIEKAKSRRDRANLLMNQAKWSAANAFCKSKGITFRILTEQQLYKRK